MTTTVKFEGNLDREHVVLEVSNGETYVSKLSHVYIVQISHGENNDGYTNATVSTTDNRTITFYTTATADTTMFVTIYGRK